MLAGRVRIHVDKAALERRDPAIAIVPVGDPIERPPQSTMVVMRCRCGEAVAQVRQFGDTAHVYVEPESTWESCET